MFLQYLQKQGLITNSAFCFNSVLLKVITGSRWQTFFSVKDLKQLWKWVISFNLPLYKPLTNETFFWCEFSHNWCIMLGFYSNVYFLVQKYLTRSWNIADAFLFMRAAFCSSSTAVILFRAVCKPLRVFISLISGSSAVWIVHLSPQCCGFKSQIIINT